MVGICPVCKGELKQLGFGFACVDCNREFELAKRIEEDEVREW